MQRTIALKLVNRGFSNIEPEAGFMVVYAAKHGETALDGDSLNSPFATVLARVIKEPRIEVENCSTSSATTSGRPPIARSSRSPTARCRGARIFTSWRGSDAPASLRGASHPFDPHGEEARQRRLEPCCPRPSFETPLRGSSG
jgi:hypothetical protein